jgi:uncharacterized membrane protein
MRKNINSQLARRSLAFIGALVALSTAAVPLLADPPTGETPILLSPGTFGGGSFECGAMCGSQWKVVGYCSGSQTCCGYIYCNSGISQNICCNQGTTCNYLRGAEPPAAAQCLVND